VFACGQTGGWTDITKLIVTFRNFANARKLSTFCPRGIFSVFLYVCHNKQLLFPYTALTAWSQLKIQVVRKVTLCPADFNITDFVSSVA